MTRVDGPRRSGRGAVLAENLPTPPVNVGFRSMPNYDALAAQAIRHAAGNGSQVFAGQRDDGFFVDPRRRSTCSRAAGRLQHAGLDAPGCNVHSIAHRSADRDADGERLGVRDRRPIPTPCIGVWSTASRPSVTARGRRRGSATSADYVQVSRLGQPLVNEVVHSARLEGRVQLARADAGRRRPPVRPRSEVPKLLSALFGIQSPPAPRNDLVTIFLKGIPA